MDQHCDSFCSPLRRQGAQGSILHSLLQPLRGKDEASGALGPPLATAAATPQPSQPGSPRLASARYDSSPSLVNVDSDTVASAAATTAAGYGGSSGGEWGDLRSVIRNPAAALSSFRARLGNQFQPRCGSMTAIMCICVHQKQRVSA